MLSAIQLSDQLSLKADKIQYVIVEWVLAAKFNTELLATEMLPEQTFGIGSVLAELLWNSVFS